MDHASIEDGHIVVRISVNELSGAAFQGLDAVGCEDGDGMDYDQLASDIVGQLNAESEDGTTPVHVMLDTAVIEASEQGADAFAYLDE